MNAADRFTQIYETHYRQVYAYARRRTTSRAAAEEVVATFSPPPGNTLTPSRRSPCPGSTGRPTTRSGMSGVELRATRVWPSAWPCCGRRCLRRGH